MKLFCTLPGSKFSKDSRADKYTGPLADSLDKTYSGNEDEDEQNNTELCYTLPCAQLSKESRGDRPQCPLIDSLDTKIHDEVVHLH